MTPRTNDGRDREYLTRTGAPGTDPSPVSKAGWRVRLLAARRSRPPRERADAASSLTRHVLALAASRSGPVCAYLPIGAEPWSVGGLDEVRAAGHEVLLPVVRGAAPLDWARYDGDLADAAFGLREPTGPRLGPDAVAGAGVVLVPGLAADRGGTRLGRGAGHYDRTLPLVGPATPLVIVLYDDELVERLPAEPHDVRMDAALRPATGLTPLGNSG